MATLTGDNFSAGFEVYIHTDTIYSQNKKPKTITVITVGVEKTISSTISKKSVLILLLINLLKQYRTK